MNIERIAVMTSGGDAPGMNGAVRAVARMADHLGLETLGIEDGYEGLLEGRIAALERHRFEGIERRGGTILGSSRSAEFRTLEGLDRALEQLRQHQVEALVVIGGEGSMKGALTLHKRGFPVVVVPASIDNDVGGTHIAIGVDTAINTAVEAIDKLRDTAAAFHRAFVIEVMGRDSGWIALQSAIAAGAEMVLIPEEPYQVEEVLDRMQRVRKGGGRHFVLVAAEGIRPSATELNGVLSQRKDTGFDARLSILGHIQRGGSPTAFDRLLAARLGARAVEELAAGRPGTLVGLQNMRTSTVPLDEATAMPHPYNPETYRFAQVLAG
jgi:6-phosphofructokinase 1